MSSPAFEVRSKAVRAGAGAGKTHNLTHQVLDFALDYRAKTQSWPRVLVTTFTRKATQELSERLIKLAMTEKPEAMEFVTSSQYLSVSTIHGILDRFLKQWGHLISLQSDFSYMKPTESAHTAKKILKNLSMRAADYGPLFMSFSFSDLRTMMLESLVDDLDGYKPITEKDLEELLVSHLAVLRAELTEVLRQAQEHESNEKLTVIWQIAGRVATLLDGATWQTHRAEALEAIDSINLKPIRVKADAPIAAAYEEFKIVLKDIRKLDEPMFDPDMFGHLAEINRQFDRLRTDFKKQFEQSKKASNKIEISDLEMFAMDIVRKYPAAAKSFAADTDYWLIDEFQDTSPRQLQILEVLIGAKPYYLVGDPQQSIYLFRGARSEVFRDKVAAIEASGGQIDILDTNYRSSPELLSFINHLSQTLGAQFQPMKSAFKDVISTGPAAQFTIIDKTDNPDKKWQAAAEMDSLLAQIFELRQQGAAFEQMSILVRTNAQLEDLGAFLNSKGLPVHLHSSGLFWERREVQDATSLLKFFLNPFDDVNLVKLLRAPFFAITDKDLADVLPKRESSVWESVRDKMRDGAYGLSGKKLFESLVSAKQLGIVVVFQRSLEALGFFDLHLQYDPTGRAEGNLWKFVHLLKTFERERGANLIRFVNDAERPERMDRTVDAPGSVEPNKINIMTVHAAKGLQFDYVFLPFLGAKPRQEKFRRFAVDESQAKWSVRAPSNEDETSSSASLFEKKVIADFKARQAEEDLRVFYVAYTRAKKQIFFSWAAPAGEGSWAELLRSLDLEAGSHEGQGFAYNVTRVDTLVTSQNAPLKARPVEIPTYFKDSRQQPWGQTAHEEHSVTKVLAGTSPIRRNYKNAFIKKTQGILFHKLLEIIKYPTAKDISGLVGDWFPGAEDEVGDALNYALALQEPPLVNLIKSGHVEWSFRTKKSADFKELEGQIDLWGELDGKLWLVDYKSGEKVLKDKSFQQLKVYASAVADYLKWDKEIHLAVVYPFLQESYIEVITKKDLIF